MPILRAVSNSKATACRRPRTRPASARKRSPAAAPHSRKSLYLTAIAVAATAAAILIAVSVTSSRSGSGQRGAGDPSGVGETAALLRGIPQHGTTLGSPNAPVRLVEYADLQCVYCGAWARDVFPTLVRRYVRTGKVQLEFRGLAFVGNDSLVGPSHRARRRAAEPPVERHRPALPQPGRREQRLGQRLRRPRRARGHLRRRRLARARRA